MDVASPIRLYLPSDDDFNESDIETLFEQMRLYNALVNRMLVGEATPQELVEYLEVETDYDVDNYLETATENLEYAISNDILSAEQ